MMDCGDFDILNFQSVVETYEAVFKDVTEELDNIQAEHYSIKEALKENSRLSSELNKALADNANTEIEHKFKDTDFIENLKLQLETVIEEKNQAIKLWQNATETVEYLEEELKVYVNNTDGLVPKAKLIETKQAYEEKVKDLEATLQLTTNKLEETIQLKAKELQVRDKEIVGALQSQDNTFKIVKNLEEEVLNLQKRISEASAEKRKLEKLLKTKSEENESMKTKMRDCTIKVEEALQVVEAALKEKDAALLREAAAEEKAGNLSKSFNDFISETDAKVQVIKREYESKFAQLNQTVQTRQEEIKIKSLEADNFSKRCNLLEKEVERCQSMHQHCPDNGGFSKMLALEKTLEDTFQKLLLSEKQNIQLKSEIESIKNDCDQMSRHYERDIFAREAEKTALKNEISKLKEELQDSRLHLTQSSETVSRLNEKILTTEEKLSFFQRSDKEHQEREAKHQLLLDELQEQLNSQAEINKKWRAETRNMSEQLEKVIMDLKMSNSKVKQENKVLNDKLKESNLKMLEYRKFLEMISQDVTKITHITLPEQR